MAQLVARTAWSERDWVAILRYSVGLVALAAAVFAISYANGGFYSTTRAYGGIAAWWVLGLGAALGAGSALARIHRLATWAVGLLAVFAVWILVSAAWAPDAGRTFAEFDLVVFYVAVLALAIVLARIVPADVLVGGVALAIFATAVVALVSRFFPSSFGTEPGTEVLNPLINRLSFPLGYWNGLGIEVALLYPLLLASMASRRSRVAAGLAALPLPVCAAVMYLTSSRGAFVAAGVAVVAFLLLSPNRWRALAATAMAGIAGAVAVRVLVHRYDLLNGAGTPLRVQQGHGAALWIGVACVVTALAWVGLRELDRWIPPLPSRAGWATAGVLVAVAIAGIVAAHPIARFHTFESNSFATGNGVTSYDTSHLLSTSGSGRWQFWTVAMSEFRAHPLNGGGAGAWQFWWLAHRPFSLFSQYAHSLYLETLGDLGIVGFLLVVGALLVAVVGAVRSALLVRSGAVAAAAACGIAFCASLAYDWVWQLTSISVIGIGMLGVALGTLPSMRAAATPRFGFGLGFVRPLAALAAFAAIVAQVVVLAAGIHLRNSQAAYRAGDGARARSEALGMKRVEPWSAQPYLQLGLILEAEGHYAVARRWFGEALSRSPRDSSIWLAAARVDALRGQIPLAEREFAEARRLDPRSSFFNPQT